MKRILSLLLAAALAAGLMALPAWAEEGALLPEEETPAAELALPEEQAEPQTEEEASAEEAVAEETPVEETLAEAASVEASAALLAEPAALSAEGESVISGAWTYTENDDGTVTVTGCTMEWNADVVIPGTIDGKTVTGLGNFWCGQAIGTLTIPASITTIESQAFYYMPPKSIKLEAGNPAFCLVDGVLYSADMTELVLYPMGLTATSYTVPDGVTKIWRYAFQKAPLTTVSLPDTLIEIGDRAFCNSALTKVVIPASVQSTSSGTLFSAFEACSGLTSAGPIGSGCDIEFGWTTEIPAWAFLNATSLKTVILPDTLERIGLGAFYGTYITKITLPATLEKIDPYVLSNAYRLEAIYVDAANPNMCAIDGVLFSKDRTELILYPVAKPEEEYVMPYQLQKMPSNSMRYVKYLQRVGLPKALTTVERYAANEWLAMTDIYYAGSEEDWANISITEPETNTALTGAIPIHYNEWLGSSIPGDLSGDGEVGAADVVLLSRYLAGDASYSVDEMAADVNGDGFVNGLDVIYLRKTLAGWQP